MENFVKRVQNWVDAIVRFFKWEFWFPIGKLPMHDEGVIIPGDPDAIPRSDPFWRDQWKWIVFSAPHPAAFRVYFESPKDGLCMCYSRKIRTPYVAMRVGPHAVKVVAMAEMRYGLDEMRLNMFLPPEYGDCMRDALAERFLLHKVTWI